MLFFKVVYLQWLSSRSWNKLAWPAKTGCLCRESYL